MFVGIIGLILLVLGLGWSFDMKWFALGIGCILYDISLEFANFNTNFHNNFGLAILELEQIKKKLWKINED